MITGTITIKVDYLDGEHEELEEVRAVLDAFANELKAKTFAVPNVLLSAGKVRPEVTVRYYPEVQTKLPLE